MNVWLYRLKVCFTHNNKLWRYEKGLYFHWLFLLCLVLSGCQVVSEETALKAATLVPSRTITLEAPSATATTGHAATATLVTPILPTPTYTPSSTLTPPTATPAPTLPITVEGFLLYEAITGESRESWVYALQPGGTSRVVAAGLLLAGQPFSPDGTRFVIDTNDWSNPPLSPDKVFILDLKTGERLPLNLSAHPRSGVFWSADGDSLLYIDKYSDDTADQLRLYDIATGENQTLVEMELILSTAGWAVDGETIAFVAEVDGQFDLFMVNSQTLERRQLTNDSKIETMILWSPTSQQLMVGTAPDEMSAFELWPWGVEKLYLVETNGNSRQLLLDNWLGSESVSWSPDGRRIVLSNIGLLCLRNLDTMAEICPLADVPPYNEYFASFSQPPVWSADGKWLAFQAFTGECTIIHFLELETSRVIVGDLGCDILSNSPLSPIYWSPADWSLVP